MEPIQRLAARVVPVSEDGAALLLLDQDPAHPGVLRWATIGGGLDEGETVVEAAVRELFEETGIVATAADLSAPFHHARRTFTYAGVTYAGEMTYVALRLPRDTPVSFEHLEPDEVGNVLEAGWFTAEAITRDGRMVEPDLPGIISAATAALQGDA